VNISQVLVAINCEYNAYIRYKSIKRSYNRTTNHIIILLFGFLSAIM